MKAPLLRKEQSIEILKQYSIPYIDWLPILESAEEVTIRSAEELAKRAIACQWVIQVACDIHSEKYDDEIKNYVLNILESMQVLDELTEKEKVILYGIDISQQDVVNMIWKYEAYWVLLWALGIIDALDYPENIVDCDFAIQAVVSVNTFEEFMQKVKLRDIEEILDQTDLTFRYNWACVDARVNQRDAPAQLNSSVVVERHGALNWLIHSEDEWDYPDTNT